MRLLGAAATCVLLCVSVAAAPEHEGVEVNADQIHDAIAELTIWREARGESYEGKLGVAMVIAARMRDDRWGNTAGEVCLQPYQFSCWRDLQLTRFPVDDPTWDECVMAWAAAKHGQQWAANHYHADYVSPDWAEGRTPVARIGHHVFYHL